MEQSEAFAARNERWNLRALLSDSAWFFFGIAMLDSSIVLPPLMARLGASNKLIGSTVLIQVIGFAIPGLLAAHYIHGRANHKRFMLLTGGLGRALIFSLPFALLLFAETNPSLALAWILGAIAAFWVLDGLCAVSWTDIVAKTILPHSRGFFFGVLQVLGGAAALTAAGVVYLVFKRGAIPFPQNYAILAGCWAIGGLGSFISLAAIREPAGVTHDDEDKPTIVQFLKEGVVLFHRNKRVNTMIVARWLLGAGGLAGPFYVLYADRTLGVPAYVAAYYIVAHCIGRIAAGPLWGWVANRLGPSHAVRWVAFPLVAAPALALIAGPRTAWTLFLTFFMLGLTSDGIWTACQNTLYESVSDRERPLAVGAMTVALVPVAFYGIAGGALTDWVSSRAAFLLALVLCACGAYVAWQVPRTQGTR
jgi:MFS family permease